MMNLEAHPIEHYVLMLCFYHVGLALNMLTGAYLSSQSKLNGLQSVAGYFKLRWIPLGMRYFACLCMFLVAWENPHLMNLERLMPNLAAHLGVSGGLGVVSDVLWDRFLAIILPGVQKELPPLPPPPVPPVTP